MSLMIQKLFNTQARSGLLALAPLLLMTSSYKIGIDIGLILFPSIFILASVLYLLRNLIPAQQRLVVVLIFSVSIVLIMRMFLGAEAYSLTEMLGLFFPLLLINSLVLSLAEDVFANCAYKSVFSSIIGVTVAATVFIIVFGFLRESLVMFSIIDSPAGCLFLMGLMFALCNVFSLDDITD